MTVLGASGAGATTFPLSRDKVPSWLEAWSKVSQTKPERRFPKVRLFELGLAAVLVIAVAVAVNSVSAPYANSDILAEPSWLLSRLDDPHVSVIDVRSPLQFRSGHIPGAVNVGDRDVHMYDQSAQGVVRSVEELEAVFQQAGINQDDTVVVYGDDRTPGMAERVFWILEYLGHQDVKLLVGGLDAWRNLGLDVSNRPVSVEPGDFVARVEPFRLAGIEDILRIQENMSGHIIDVRSQADYNGQIGSPRTGHIPGSAHLPIERMIDEAGRFRRSHGLKLALSGVQVHPWHESVVYGSSGTEAAPMYVALRLLNAPVRLFDASFSAWAADEQLKVNQFIDVLGGQAGLSTTCW